MQCTDSCWAHFCTIVEMGARKWIAVSWGCLMGALTFAAGPLALLSNHVAIAFLQSFFTYLLFPGLIVAAAVGSLLPAAGVNAMIHFGLCFFLLRFLPAFKQNAVQE